MMAHFMACLTDWGQISPELESTSEMFNLQSPDFSNGSKKKKVPILYLHVCK